MICKVYKDILGWHEENEKHTGTGILLSIEEYQSLCEEKKQAVYQQSVIRSELENEKKRTEQALNREIALKNQEIHEIKQQLEHTNSKLQTQRDLNENLLRINRERSNSDRKLQPKKSHHGYVILQSQEKAVFYRGSGSQKKFVAWETVVQTPYSVDLKPELAKQQIIDEINTDDDNCFFSQVGIDDMILKDPQKILDDRALKELNIVFRLFMRVNRYNKYWEMILMHTKALEKIIG